MTEKLSRNLELEKRRSESLEQKAKNAFRKSGLSDFGYEVSSATTIFVMCNISYLVFIAIPHGMCYLHFGNGVCNSRINGADYHNGVWTSHGVMIVPWSHSSNFNGNDNVRYHILLKTTHTGYIEVIMQRKCGRNTETTFDIKWVIGTYGNWKKSKSWGPFWSYQLNSTANSAHLAHFMR